MLSSWYHFHIFRWLPDDKKKRNKLRWNDDSDDGGLGINLLPIPDPPDKWLTFTPVNHLHLLSNHIPGKVVCEGYGRDGRSRDAPTGAKQELGREGSFERFRDTEVFVNAGFFERSQRTLRYDF